MKSIIAAAFLALAAVAGASQVAQAESPAADPRAVPTTVEYYYRIKWGALHEFVELYEKNHKRLLDEMAKKGFILQMTTEYPSTHLAGGVRWDMRVRIVYRDAAAAINDPAWETAWADAKKRFYKDAKKLEAEESRRFSLVEDHWDVIVADFPGY